MRSSSHRAYDTRYCACIAHRARVRTPALHLYLLVLDSLGCVLKVAQKEKEEADDECDPIVEGEVDVYLSGGSSSGRVRAATARSSDRKEQRPQGAATAGSREQQPQGAATAGSREQRPQGAATAGRSACREHADSSSAWGTHTRRSRASAGKGLSAFAFCTRLRFREVKEALGGRLRK